MRAHLDTFTYSLTFQPGLRPPLFEISLDAHGSAFVNLLYKIVKKFENVVCSNISCVSLSGASAMRPSTNVPNL